VYTDHRGALSAHFAIPAASPGTYDMLAQLNGVTVAATTFAVVSTATLDVHVTGEDKTRGIRVEGASFLPHIRVLLVVYSMSGSMTPMRLGIRRSGRQGMFRLERSISALQPGQYVVRALSLSNQTAQVSEGFFQVAL